MRDVPLLVLATCASLLVAGCAQPAPDDRASGASSDQAGAANGGGSLSGTQGTSQPSQPQGQGSAPGGQTGSSGQVSGTSGSGSLSTSQTSTGSTLGTGVFFDVGRAVHEAAWLCQTPVTVDDATSGGTDGQQCKVTLSFTDTAVTVKTTGIPNHDYESGGGCCTKAQAMTYTFPLKPEMAKSITFGPQRGATALAANGVAIYGPEDNDDQDVVIATYSSPTNTPRLEMCDGHSTPASQGGVYHYHADGNCMHWHAGAGESWSDYDFSKVDSSAHSKIIGFAPDGFPIYGSYGYAADNQTVQEMRSSYQLKAGATGSKGIDDQEYVAGLGDLDACNGKFGPTPEFPSGIYHYYSTKHNGAGSWGFPYFPHCYKGVVSSSSGFQVGGAGGTGGGTMPGGGGMTSTSGSMTGAPPPGGGGSSSTSTSCPPPPPPGSPPPSSPPPPGCGPPPS